MDYHQSKQNGFTLLEILLVLGIIGGIMVLAINFGTREVAQQRRDKTAIQAQQILNSGLAYYTAYGSWPVSSCTFNSTSSDNGSAPVDLATLTGAGYLPSTVSNNPYGYQYLVSCDSVTGSVFYLTTQLDSKADALIVAGELPMAYLSDEYGNANENGVYVTAQVTTPGQNLNNARSVNFVGIYHNGACVPVPACPGYDPVTSACTSGTNCMVPQIMVAPVAVSGVSDTNSNNAYPITSFTAYALPMANESNMQSCPAVIPPATSPTQTTEACTFGSTGIPSQSGMYWRVCLQVVTGKGIVSSTNTGTGTSAWGQYASMIVMTRCSPPNEPFGSDFSVFTQ